MKRFIFVLPLLFAFSLVFGQTTQMQVMMTKGNNNALVTPLKKTQKKEVEEAWMKYIKDYKGKTKKDKKSGEIFTDNAMIKDLSANTVDIYTKVLEKNEDTELVVWFDLGGAYLNANTHPAAYQAATALLGNFQLSVSTAAMEDQVKMQEEVLKKMTKELEDMVKEQKNAEDDIAKYQKKIEEAQNVIVESAAAQKAKEMEIADQKKIMKELNEKVNMLKKG